MSPADPGRPTAPYTASSPTAQPGGLSLRARAILWMLAGSLLVTFMAALVKTLGNRMPAIELASVRALILVAALLPFMLRRGRGVFVTGQPGLMLARSGTLAIVNAVGFWTLTVLPLAYVTSISFSKPLFVTLLAVLLLGERVRLRRGLATLAGFLGVLVMLNPRTIAFGSAELWAAGGALGVAFSMALGVILVKRLTETDQPSTIIFYSNLGVVILLALPTAIYWVQPTGEEWILLALLGLVGLVGQNCFIRAYRAAEASFVAPFEYTRILTAAAVGYLLFSEVPDIWTWVGAAMITAATLYLAHRERIGARQSLSGPPHPPD